AEAFADVSAGDVDDQAQVGADHLVTGLDVALLADAVRQLLLLGVGEQRRLVDLAEVRLQRRLDRIISEPARASHRESQRCGDQSTSLQPRSFLARKPIMTLFHPGRKSPRLQSRPEIPIHVRITYRPWRQGGWNRRLARWGRCVDEIAARAR